MKEGIAFCLALILLGAAPAVADTTFNWPSTDKSSSDSAAQKKKKAEKKTTTNHPASGNRIYKENGKTCSGLGAYKVCW
jgi:hypothetical protein